MNRFSRLFKLVAVSGAAASTAYLIKDQVYEQRRLHAAWTNTYESSTKWDFNWDRRGDESVIKRSKHSASTKDLTQPEKDKNIQEKVKATDDSELNKQSTKASRHLFLIRHGQYNMNTKNPNEMKLTDLGREQADFTGRRLKELMSKYKFNKIHHSNMVRAVETAQIIRTHLPNELPVFEDPMIAEGAPIPPEPPVGHWKPEFHKFFQDGARIEAAFRKYFYRAPPEQLEDSFEIVVCHANVIRYFFCRGLQFPADAWLRLGLFHGSITHMIIRPDGRVSCHFLGEAGYMPVEKNTSS